MRKTKILILDEPVILHEKTYTELTFQEPTGAQFLDHGEPRLWSRSKDDMFYMIDNDPVIRKYIDLCVTPADAAQVIPLLCLNDARDAREIVLGFFHRADKAT